MGPLALSALIGGGASLLGNIFSNQQSNRDSNQNIALQKEFAQKGIRWKVEDAKEAGIHPLTAMGVQSAQFQPVYQNTPDFSQHGQDLTRAMNVGKTGSEKQASLIALKGLKLDNTKKEIENAILKRQYEGYGGPNMASYDSQGILNDNLNVKPSVNGSGVQYKMPEVPLSASPGVQAGTPPMQLFTRNKYNSAYPVAQRDIQEAISEGSMLTKAKYAIGEASEIVKATLFFINPYYDGLKQWKADWLASRPVGRKGEIALWDVPRGMWHFVKKTPNNESSIFLQTPIIDRKIPQRFKSYLNNILGIGPDDILGPENRLKKPPYRLNRRKYRR